MCTNVRNDSSCLGASKWASVHNLRGLYPTQLCEHFFFFFSERFEIQTSSGMHEGSSLQHPLPRESLFSALSWNGVAFQILCCHHLWWQFSTGITRHTLKERKNFFHKRRGNFVLEQTVIQARRDLCHGCHPLPAIKSVPKSNTPPPRNVPPSMESATPNWCTTLYGKCHPPHDVPPPMESATPMMHHPSPTDVPSPPCSLWCRGWQVAAKYIGLWGQISSLNVGLELEAVDWEMRAPNMWCPSLSLSLFVWVCVCVCCLRPYLGSEQKYRFAHPIS